MLCDQDIFDKINSFSVGQRSESPHFPLTFSVKVPNIIDIIREPGNYCSNDHHLKYTFNNENIISYREALKSTLTNDRLHDILFKIESPLINVNDIITELQNILKQSASCCAQHKRHKKHDQPVWFDRECKNLKSQKYKCLRRYRCTQSIADLNQYKQARNDFKALVDRKQKDFNTDQLNSLIESAQNPKSFWKKVKKLSCNTRATASNISIEEWKEHFEQLFMFENYNDVVDETDDTDMEFEIDLDETENIVFNSEITEEEILKSVKALHESKAAGLMISRLESLYML